METHPINDLPSAQKLAIQHAITGYTFAHPELGGKDLEEFKTKVINRILTKVRTNLEDKKKRRDRAALINSSMDLFGLKAKHFRIKTSLIDYEKVDDLVKTLLEGGTDPLVNRAAKSIVKESAVSPCGGVTFLYKIEAGNQVEFSASICRIEENFDKLEGRERALERFKNGVTSKTTVDVIESNPSEIIGDFLKVLRQE